MRALTVGARVRSKSAGCVRHFTGTIVHITVNWKMKKVYVVARKDGTHWVRDRIELTPVTSRGKRHAKRA